MMFQESKIVHHIADFVVGHWGWGSANHSRPICHLKSHWVITLVDWNDFGEDWGAVEKKEFLGEHESLYQALLRVQPTGMEAERAFSAMGLFVTKIGSVSTKYGRDYLSETIWNSQ